MSIPVTSADAPQVLTHAAADSSAKPVCNSIFPTGDFLSDEPPLESSLHLQQMLLLLSCLDWLWQDRNDYFSAGNLTVYYSERQLKSEKFRGPDFFVVLGTERKPRDSWVVWQEGGKYPNIIIELLSDSTANVDRETKKTIYQDAFRTPEYFWFDPKTLEFEGFELINSQYEAIIPTETGRLWSKQLQLFLGIQDNQLRYFFPDGGLVPTLAEVATETQIQIAEAKSQVQAAEVKAAEAKSQVQAAEVKAAEAQSQIQAAEVKAAEAQSQIQAAENQAAMEQAKAEQFAQKLRELGVDPNSI